MATTIGSAAFKLSADSAAFEADVKRATKAAERMSASLEKQIAVFGKTASEAKAYELSQRGVDAELLASISALESQKKALADQSAAVDRGKAIFDATRTAEEKYKAEISNLNGLLMRGALSFDTYNRAVKQAGANLPSVKKATEDAARAQREHDAVMQRGKQVFDSTRTAEEKYERELRDLDDLLRRGAIDQETFNRAVRRGEKDMKSAAGSSDKLSAGGLLGGGIKAGIAGVAAAVTARAAVQFGSDSVSAYQEQLSAERKLQGVLNATGHAAGLTTQEIATYAGELQSLTGIGDEVFLQSATTLGTFRKVSGDTFKDAILLSQDMATAFGGDASSAAMQLGKALNDPILGLTALRKSGVTFDEQQKEQIKTMVKVGDIAGAQQVILAELKEEFGGTAANAKNSSTAMSNAWGDVKEGIGAVISESTLFKGTSNFLTDTFTRLSNDLRIYASGTTDYAAGQKDAAAATDVMTAAAEREAAVQKKLNAELQKQIKLQQELSEKEAKEARGKFVADISAPSAFALDLEKQIKGFGKDGVDAFLATLKTPPSDAMLVYLQRLQAELKGLEAEASKAAALESSFNSMLEATKTPAEKIAKDLKGISGAVAAGIVAIERDLANGTISISEYAKRLEEAGKVEERFREKTFQDVTRKFFGTDEFDKYKDALKELEGFKGVKIIDEAGFGKVKEKLLKDLGKDLFGDLDTPLEKFEKEAARIRKFIEAGGDAELASRAIGASAKEFRSAATTDNTPAALLAGSQAALSAINRFQNQGKTSTIEEQTLGELRELVRIQKEAAKAAKKPPEVAKLAP